MRLGQPVMVGLRYEGERAHGAPGLLLPCSGNGILLKQWVCTRAESRCQAWQVSGFAGRGHTDGIPADLAL